MPKVGMEPIRRDALVKATILEIGRAGSLDVTVSQIAKRAGMSSALAHHYFGNKDKMFLAAMRHILGQYGAHVRAALAGARTPRQRVEAVIRAGFDDLNFSPEVISAWLNFYVQAQNAPDVARLLRIYQHRLRSNLRAGLRPLAGPGADALAEGLAAMIDGLYIRQSLREAPPDGAAATAMVLDYLDAKLEARA
ncbi:choline-binding transcriptional repressor BetI [Actibacterium ureilyticum]|uniref:choline-binding transcriptional repressor BetI n=1 Tax=Actibacterium ureilyticum TaxID=1590614 RepID=UPI000BAACE1E|nr:transcriptional regulator BetI [Actibacterium ureilyticum]